MIEKVNCNWKEQLKMYCTAFWVGVEIQQSSMACDHNVILALFYLQGHLVACEQLNTSLILYSFFLLCILCPAMLHQPFKHQFSMWSNIFIHDAFWECSPWNENPLITNMLGKTFVWLGRIKTCSVLTSVSRTRRHHHHHITIPWLYFTWCSVTIYRQQCHSSCGSEKLQQQSQHLQETCREWYLGTVAFLRNVWMHLQIWVF